MHPHHILYLGLSRTAIDVYWSHLHSSLSLSPLRVGSDQLLPWAIDSLHSNTHNPSNTESGGRGVVTVAATGAHLTAIKPPVSLIHFCNKHFQESVSISTMYM